METRSLTPATRQALAALLDDPSPAVRRALLAHLQSLRDVGREFLRGVANGPNRLLGMHARWYLVELDFADPVAEFRGFIRSLHYELETGSILLCRTVYPELEVEDLCTQLDAIASRCRELTVDAMSARERCRVINRVLFHEMGFRGNTEDYSDPDNSFLNRVLERRKGLPISLSIVYLLVAERLGLSLEGVGLPGHYMVGCYAERPAFFIDTFDHGRFLEPDDVLRYLVGHAIEPDITHLTPTTVRETLSRCCRNLARHYAEGGNPPFARLFASFVDEFEAAYEENMPS